ncbi:hypothetical protein V8G54_023498 [Vigna mungo]|uniref:Secreted protein n=1 Tax=Vigna mungo TaxID=3915 RepID=A0AAQ3N576_VIGMU
MVVVIVLVIIVNLVQLSLFHPNIVFCPERARTRCFFVLPLGTTVIAKFETTSAITRNTGELYKMKTCIRSESSNGPTYYCFPLMMLRFNTNDFFIHPNKKTTYLNMHVTN